MGILQRLHKINREWIKYNLIKLTTKLRKGEKIYVNCQKFK